MFAPKFGLWQWVFLFFEVCKSELCGCLPVGISEYPNHMRGGGETALLGDVFDWVVGVPKESTDGL